jgi:hypothetical protein
MKTISVHFGALCPSIAEQLIEQGVVAIPDEINHFQGDADAITRLMFRGMLSDSQAHTARQKLLKKIVRAVEKATKKHEADHDE